MKKITSPENDIFLTSTQASKLINVSVGTLKKYVQQGKIKALKTPGGHYRFSRRDLFKKLYKKWKR